METNRRGRPWLMKKKSIFSCHGIVNAQRASHLTYFQVKKFLHWVCMNILLQAKWGLKTCQKKMLAARNNIILMPKKNKKSLFIYIDTLRVTNFEKWGEKVSHHLLLLQITVLSTMCNGYPNPNCKGGSSLTHSQMFSWNNGRIWLKIIAT